MADNRYERGGSTWSGERGRERSNSIFGDNDRERERYRSSGGGGNDRGFIERAGEKIGEWFGGDDDRGGDWSGGQRSHSGGGQGGDRFGGPEHQHYRSWRDRQIAELDRDYEEYCSERQQQFHTDFHSWRENRQAGQTGLGTSASTGSSGGSGLMSGSGGTTGGGDEGGSGTGSTASSRTSALLGTEDEAGPGGGEAGSEAADTGSARSRSRS